MNDKDKKELLEFLIYGRGRMFAQLKMAEKIYEQYAVTKDIDDPTIEEWAKRMTKLKTVSIKYNHFIKLLKTELGFEVEPWEQF